MCGWNNVNDYFAIKYKYINTCNISYSHFFILTPYKYCEPYLTTFKYIVNINKNVKMFSHHDLIPSSLYDKYIMKKYINHKLIINTVGLSLESKSIEINYILYNQYISFPKYIVHSVSKYITKFKNEYKIGLQLRFGDRCIYNNCAINNVLIKKVLKELNDFNRSKYIIFYISDSYKNISSYFNQSVYSFKKNIKPWHSKNVSKTKYGKNLIQKLIGDIIFYSASQTFLISPYSTYGLLAFHLGALSSGIIKPYRILGSNLDDSIYNIFEKVDLKSKC